MAVISCDCCVYSSFWLYYNFSVISRIQQHGNYMINEEGLMKIQKFKYLGTVVNENDSTDKLK